jgi:hypothetical protein
MEELTRLKRLMLLVTKDLISNCRYCVEVFSDPDDKTPIQCIKYAGCSSPISVNAATCLSCQEYKKKERLFQLQLDSNPDTEH